MELKKLLDEIATHTSLLKELLRVLQQETVQMGNIDISAMGLSNQTKEELTARIAEQSPRLLDAVSALFDREGLSGKATLGALAGYLSKKGNRELLDRQQEMLLIIENIQRVAALNQEISERFASSVTSTLGLITRLINQSNVYGATGGYQLNSAGAVMINREA